MNRTKNENIGYATVFDFLWGGGGQELGQGAYES